jgi:hypothetical protein
LTTFAENEELLNKGGELGDARVAWCPTESLVRLDELTGLDGSLELKLKSKREEGKKGRPVAKFNIDKQIAGWGSLREFLPSLNGN